MLAPVVIFVYNRLNHTQKMIEALSENYLASESDVYIFSDGGETNAVKMVRNYLDLLKKKNVFKSLSIEKAQNNLGLANSVISGVSKIIEKFKKVIVLEDDLITSKDFLVYMNEALEFYKNNEKIWSISGYNIPIKIADNYKHDIYMSYRGCSWGWATWANRWEKVDWKVLDYKEFNYKRKKMFNRGGRDLSLMLGHQMDNKIDSWAIRWCYTQSKLDLLTVYPIVSRVENIGLDGSGTHSGSTNKYNVFLNNDMNYQVKFEDIGVNNKLIKKFKNHYLSFIKYIIIEIRNLLSS